MRSNPSSPIDIASSNDPGAPTGGKGIVEVRRKGAGYVVEVMPATTAYPAKYFDDLRTAWGHAGGIRLATGWRKVDLTAAGDDGQG